MGKYLIHSFEPGRSTESQRMLWIITALAGVVRYIPDAFRDNGDIITRRRRRTECPDYSSECPDYSSECPDYSSECPDYSSEFPDYSSECGKREPKRRKIMPSQLSAFPINSDIVSQILGWIKYDNINTMGIYGMGGIGKTTLAKQVQSRVQYSDNPFTDNADELSATAWVSVGLNFIVSELQQKIAEGFGLDLRGDKDVIRRAALLNARLSHMPDPILFLDDLWEDFRREDVGIPRHCKLVIISRSLDVCRIIRCQKFIKVEPLPEEQAWQLFVHALGDKGTLQSRREIEEIAKLLCFECGGVPFAIDFLAKSMRDVVDVSRWRATLRSLNESSNKAMHFGDMLAVLRKSYDNLSSNMLKQCFLLCALHSKGNEMSRKELIHSWIRRGLIGDADSEYDMGHSILNKLQRSCLLEATEDSKGVKMHDLVRDMAIFISKDLFCS